MTASTHYAFSYLLLSSAGINTNTALVSSLFSLLPDLDHPQSLIGRIFPGISKRILRKYGHRTITHSVFSILVLALLFTPIIFFSKSVYLSLILSYFSHIFIDLFNRSGVKLFAPYSQKEYISFRTEQLRILVSSWQEYLLLFIVVFLAFSITGKSFSISGGVRSISKIFYKSYDNAKMDFQENSNFQCSVKVKYFDDNSRKKLNKTFKVLNIYPDEIFVLDNRNRKVIKKTYIEEIELLKSKNEIISDNIKGDDLNKIAEIENNSFVSGEIFIYGFLPDIKNSEYIQILKSPSKTILTLRYAEPNELHSIIYLNRSKENKIADLKIKLSSYQVKQLKIQRDKISNVIRKLKYRGFYANYSRIIKLDNELKKIESRIDTLNMRIAAGSDEPIQREIKHIQELYNVKYDLYVYKFQN